MESVRSIRFPRGQEKAVGPPLERALFRKQPVCRAEAVKTALHRKAGELPFDDPRKPDQRPYLEKADAPEMLPPLQNGQAGPL